jgi:uncharacterized protein
VKKLSYINLLKINFIYFLGAAPRKQGMKDTARNCLLFFVKDPESGRVKTRLAAVLGQDKATELYRCFVLDMLDTLDSVAQRDTDLVVCFTPNQARPQMEGWLGRERSYLAQAGEDLGQRMCRAFARTFAQACNQGYEQVVLLGSDLPGLPPSVLTTALDELDRHGAVLGPAIDGGYYLIGFQRESFLPTVFENMAWGGPKVCQETLARMQAAGIEPALAPEWQDVDRPEDLEALRHDPEIKRNAPRTFAALAALTSCTNPQDRPK